MECLLVVLFLPADGQVVLFVAFEIGRPHRGLDQSPIHGFVGHAALLLPGAPSAKPPATPARRPDGACNNRKRAERANVPRRSLGRVHGGGLPALTVENRLASVASSVR